MSKLIRHTQKRGTALFVALSLTALTLLSLVSFVGSPQQSANKDSGRLTSERGSQIGKDADATKPPSRKQPSR